MSSVTRFEGSGCSWILLLSFVIILMSTGLLRFLIMVIGVFVFLGPNKNKFRLI